MWAFLGVFMVFIVSGYNEVTIKGILEESVLLPCHCPGGNSEFKWQMDEPRAIVALDHDSNTSYSEESYKGRTKTFVAEDGNNCSLYLTNITANDQGKYSCRFYIKGQYTHISINLSISANYRVCQNSSSDINDTIKGETQPKYLMRFFKIIPIVLVLGLSLVLWRCWKISQRFTGDERGED
ncbi:uncharacterized protein [Trachinotus anak]|uniref:uncharacterized protein isoform X3 n=1 Tax=Trachinotus anak TaxID=443729 RepID=UPI0039F1948D